ncbi:Similar to hypothetical protein SNOG_05763 [Phaeosphaeria nodorum SN15]; acc. no. XP_001796160 [Pyronema omphalodes CBS 100304]|uniref:Uncharacterized protein n=1 Tax=Pyronema omphalodes (strain CBS 100304) TaxID=1076935 RepID=U4LHQ4_PYROM|nr:Similar to hypothetical protein SNOG_05763 [Phaeosphaeria nodorum SN15]; acc. no. XP_001796160 [Pyronema omphalodes CBS 100304]
MGRTWIIKLLRLNGFHHLLGGRTRVASLVLGGYNAIRFQPNNVTFNLGTEQYKEIKAPLTSLTLSMTKESGIKPINNILDKPINVSINSITSYIWLPKTACEKIEKAFNLTWNEAEQFYLLDDVTYQNLKKASPTFTFTLSNGTGDVHINIPYEALDLDIALPVLKMVPQNQTVKVGQGFCNCIFYRIQTKLTIVAKPHITCYFLFAFSAFFAFENA